MKKDTFEKKLARLEEKRSELKKKAEASQSVEEVRAIAVQLDELNNDITETRGIIDEIEAEERTAEPVKVGEKVPANAHTVNGEFRSLATFKTSEARNDKPFASEEYRSAFRDYIVNGKEIPAEYRTGDAVNTTNNGAVIPYTIVDRVVNTYRARYGVLYSKVLKTNFPGGVGIPVGNLQAEFKWATESTVAPQSSLGTTALVQFGLNKVECNIAQTYLSGMLSISAFEDEFAKQITIAFAKAMDIAIVKGNGNGQPLGILNDPSITNVVTMTAAQIRDYTYWRKNILAKIPEGYEGGEFIMARGTVEGELLTMNDANGRPIYREATGAEINSGDDRYPSGRIFGRDISVVMPTVLRSYEDASSGEAVAIYWIPETTYAMNEPIPMTVRRVLNEFTDNFHTIARAYVDGKVINPEGVFIIKKA